MNKFLTASACLLLVNGVLFAIISNASESSPLPHAPITAPEKPANIAVRSNPAGHNKEITMFALSPDGRSAVTGDEDENNFLWDVKTGGLLSTIAKQDQMPVKVVAASFSPDASQLLWTRYRKHMPVLWDLKNGKRLGVFSSKEKGHQSEVVSLSISSDGKYVATGDVQGTIVLWNMKERTPVRKFKAHAGRVGFLTFIPGRAEFVSAGDEGAVRLWMMARSLVSELKAPGTGVTALTVSADGALVYAASGDGVVRGWNVALRSLRGSITFDGRQINGIAISPDGDLMALAEEDESILVWNIRESRTAWRKRMDKSALQVKFSPDGRSLYTSGGDNWIREWEASSGRFIGKFAGVGE